MGAFRVAMLGCGQVSADHMVAWSRCRGAQVVVTCDIRRERAEGRAREFGVAAVYDTAEALFAREHFDLVDIATPRETHAELVRLAAHHGVHTLCEKPLCPTHAEAVALVSDVGGSIRLMVNENWRYRLYYTRIGDWIREGRVGAIVNYRIALWRSNMIPGADGVPIALKRQPFMAKEARLLIAECLIHELDVTRSLLGELRVVAARIGRASHQVIGEDTASILIETAGGVPVTVEGVLSAAGHPARTGDRLEIAGTRCSVLLDDAVLRLFGAEQEEHRFEESEARQSCFDASIQHFVDRMASGEPFWTSAEDQLETLKLVDDAYALAGSLRRLAP